MRHMKIAVVSMVGGLLLSMSAQAWLHIDPRGGRCTVVVADTTEELKDFVAKKTKDLKPCPQTTYFDPNHYVVFGSPADLVKQRIDEYNHGK
jgi:hypothetical protein